MSTTTITTVELSAADLGMTVGRKSSLPTTATALISQLRAAVTEWDKLSKVERTDGGKIAAEVRKAKKVVKALISDHGADAEAVRVIVAERKILTADNDVVMAAIFPKPKVAAKPKATTAAKAA